MLNIKKMIALNIIAFIIIISMANYFAKPNLTHCDESCAKAAASFPKANDFSIVNILSLQFR